MIGNDEQLRQAVEQIQRLCRAIESLRVELMPINPKNFAVMAEGPIDDIRKLQSDIDSYLSELQGLAA